MKFSYFEIATAKRKILKINRFRPKNGDSMDETLDLKLPHTQLSLHSEQSITRSYKFTLRFGNIGLEIPFRELDHC